MTYPTIPAATIVFSVISFVLAVIVPIAAVIFCRIKYKMPLYPILFGALCFPLFVYFFEASANRFLLGALPIRSNPIIFVLFGAFMAGLFEETGRLISFTIIEKISKKPRTALTGISYGFGHGGLEAVTLVGLSMLSMVIFGISVNSGLIYEGFDQMFPAEQNAITNAVTSVSMQPSWTFLISGLERIIAIAAQLGFSVIMYYAVFAKRKIWLFPVAVGVHMLTDIPAMLYQAEMITNIVVIECITAFIAAGVIVFAAWVNDKYKNDLSQPVAAGTEIAKTGETDITVTSETETEPALTSESQAEPALTSEQNSALSDESESEKN
jgi:uncharacterized membrane protein YhfC